MKRALVTGGGGALGAEISRALARAGMHVVVHAHGNAARAEALSKEIVAAGGRSEVALFDVRDPAACSREIDRLLEGGALQVLVHNAGITADAPMAGMSAEQWSSVIDVSLNGFYNVARPLLLPMLRTRWGRIVALSSVAGIMGNRGQANYAAAKAGVAGMTRALARELGSRNITVNCIAPGFIDTDMTRGLSEQQTQALLLQIPLGMLGHADDIGLSVVFLASPAASYITGVTLHVNGGMYMS